MFPSMSFDMLECAGQEPLQRGALFLTEPFESASGKRLLHQASGFRTHRRGHLPFSGGGGGMDTRLLICCTGESLLC